MTALRRGIPDRAVEIAVQLLATAVSASCLWWSLQQEVPPLPAPTRLMVLTFLAIITLGELARVTALSQRESAPLSTAAALALVMTTLTEQPTSVVTAPLVVLVAGVAMGLAAAVRWLRGQPLHAAETSARLIAVAVAAVLYRYVPFEGRPLIQWHRDFDEARWALAVIMVLVATAAMAVKLVLDGACRAERDHAPLGRTVADEFRSGLGMSTALVTTATLIALAEEALGVVALPLFLVPLVLTEVAVRRYSAVRANYRQTIGALSSLTERAGYTRQDHAARVASLAVSMGRDLGLSQREITDLEYAALLHDLGQVALREPIPGGATLLAAPADQQRIARDGSEIVRRTGVLDGVARILQAQNTPYRQVREFGEDLPLASRIIKVANAFDDLSDGDDSPRARERAMERIHLGLGYEYDPRVVDALARVLDRRRQARWGGAGAG